jgi:hypothetical protein
MKKRPQQLGLGFGFSEWQYVQDNDDDMLPSVSMPAYGGVPTREGVQGTHFIPAPTQPGLVGEHEPPVTRLPNSEPLKRPESAPNHPEYPAAEQVQTPPPTAPIPVETPLPIKHPASPQREKMEYKTDETATVTTVPTPVTIPIPERPNTRSQALPRQSTRTPKPKAFGLLEPDIEYWSSFIEPYGTPSPIASKVKAHKDPDLLRHARRPHWNGVESTW